MHIIVVLLALFSITESLGCTAEWQCNNVSNHSNYVDCVAGQCKCSTLGFVGNATSINKCRCLLPNKVYYDNGIPYCINYANAAKCHNDNLKEDRQMSAVNELYSYLVWPAPPAVIYALNTGTPHPMFDLFVPGDGVKGRVNPVGNFYGRDGVVEYFVGPVWTGSTRISKVTVKKLISQGNLVFVNMVLFFERWDPTLQNKLGEYNLTQSGTFTFNEEGKITSTDLTIPNLGATTDASNPISDPKSPEFIMQVCGIILGAANCTQDKDPQGYYTGYPDCIDKFTNVYEGGTFDNIYFNGNTSVCRFWHSLLAIARPEHHCSHSGKGGGGKCINHPYESYYTEDF